MLEPIADQIPQELKVIDRWCAWTTLNRSGKITKPPVNAITGKYAKVDNPQDWHNFDQAWAYYTSHKDKIHGVGFLIAPPFVGIDIDNCLQDGNLMPWAEKIVNKLCLLGFVELSPSGNGVHAVIKGHKKNINCKRVNLGPEKTGKIEVYSDSRYFTCTGALFKNARPEIAQGPEAQSILDKLLDFISKANQDGNVNTSSPVENENNRINTGRGDNSSLYAYYAALVAKWTDEELLRRARSRSKSFRDLFDNYHPQEGKSQNEDDLLLCQKLAWWTHRDVNRIDRLFRQSAMMRGKWNRQDYREDTIQKAIARCEGGYGIYLNKIEPTKNNKKLALDPNKPTIIYAPGQNNRELEELDSSIKNDAWQRDKLIVRVVKLPVSRSLHGLKQPGGLSVIEPFDRYSLTSLANKCANWIKFKEDTKTGECLEIPISPPADIIAEYLSSYEYWKIPPLAGLITCPIIRYDGSILEKAGYDPITGLYADFNQKSFPIVKSVPTKDDASHSMDTLLDAIKEFPFKTDVDRAVALAAMLTTVLRPSVDHAPLFALNAPSPGTGKSTLADLIGIMMTGLPCSAMDYNADEAELKKALFATVLEGAPIVLIDNVVGELNSSLLNIILSQNSIKGRVLGVSKNANLPTNSLWLATGNNLLIVGDLTRRTLFCTLDAEAENPEERVFSRDIYKWTIEHRGELVHSALTILKAYIVANKPLPDGFKQMHGFNTWSNLVRGALLWLGKADPKESQLEIKAHDPERQALANIMAAWWEHFHNDFVTTKDLLNRNPPEDADGRPLPIPDTQVNLYQALINNIQHRKELTGFILAKWLARYEGRVVNGMRFLKAGDKQNFTYWRLYKV